MIKEEVLSRIRLENGSFSVCGDEFLSMKIADKILEKQLPTIHQKRNLKAEYEKLLLPVNNQAEEMSFEENMKIIFENKDITWQVKKGTRFRFMKRAVNRILKLTNNYQQAVNTAEFSLLQIIKHRFESFVYAFKEIVKKIEDVEIRNYKYEDDAFFIHQKLEMMQKQIDELKEENKELQAEVKKLSK